MREDGVDVFVELDVGSDYNSNTEQIRSVLYSVVKEGAIASYVTSVQGFQFRRLGEGKIPGEENAVSRSRELTDSCTQDFLFRRFQTIPFMSIRGGSSVLNVSPLVSSSTSARGGAFSGARFVLCHAVLHGDCPVEPVG